MLTRTKFFPLLLLIPCCLIAVQDKKAEKNKTSQLTFRVPVNVVVVNATVKDRKGNSVLDLQQSDFKIYEDGKLQTINTFVNKSYLPDQESAEESRIPDSADASFPPLQPISQSTRPRMISIFIDDLTVDSLDYYPRLVKALEKYVASDMGPHDHVGILLGSGRLQFPFSDNKQLLSETITGLQNKISIPFFRSTCPEISDLQAYKIAVLDDRHELEKAAEKTRLCINPFAKNEGQVFKVVAIQSARTQDQESEYRTLSLLDTLRKHIRSLKHFDAEKSVIIFSDGFLPYLDCGSCAIPNQLQEIVNLALSSGVVLNCVNLRGLESGMDVSRRPDPSGEAMTDALNDILEQEIPLEQLSHDTGGPYFHNNNDLHDGIQQVVHRESHYYILTYATSSQKPDGSYHQIKLEVSRSGLEISYRKGYYSPKEEVAFEKRKKEDIIDALQAPGNLNEIPITLSYNCYRNDNATYGVSFLTNFDIRKLQFLDEDARHKNLISLVLAAYDEKGKFMDGLEKTVDLKLLDSSFAGVLQHGLSSRVELKLPFGRYIIKAVVRESVQGKLGSLTKAIEVP